MNGNWGSWTAYTKCNAVCGGGHQERERVCNDPPSAHGGLECLLSIGNGTRGEHEKEKRVCNTNVCPGKNDLVHTFSL